MHEDGELRVGHRAHQRRDMILMRVHAAGRKQPSHMHRAFRHLDLRNQIDKRRAMGEAAILDRHIDARQILRHHAAGADIHVADFGIAHLALRQADGAAGRGEQRMRILRQQPRVVRRLRLGDGVVGCIGPPAPAVENAEHRGTRGADKRFWDRRASIYLRHSAPMRKRKS